MRCILALLLALLSVGAHARTQDAFRIDVVSIKPTPPDTQGGSCGTRPGGGVSTVNMPMSSLIGLAYLRGVPPGLTRVDVDCAARRAAFQRGETPPIVGSEGVFRRRWHRAARNLHAVTETGAGNGA